ncbi:hypothetical protein DEO72_LG9g1579 [Vigna unguiculata]|uniref:Uncharacterized protein n=1 Tax=Vigna unguiculata TaxID=3917 RepID=A0A4D6N383_VIGUN|nr:hypothetical protein DEO72_LG9g1579 [Vigna unguiculata]
MRFPHVLMEHKTSPLLILHRMRISGLARLQQPQPPQPNPTQQNSKIPQPHSQQPNNEEDDHVNEESSPDYEDY